MVEVPSDRPEWCGKSKTLIPSGIEQPFCNHFDSSVLSALSVVKKRSFFGRGLHGTQGFQRESRSHSVVRSRSNCPNMAQSSSDRVPPDKIDSLITWLLKAAAEFAIRPMPGECAAGVRG
jgi:hypothetical protein